MSRRPGLALVALCLASVTACERRPQRQPAVERPHYTLGTPWQSGGYWFYPAEALAYHAKGLAIVDAPRGGARTHTADGETYDPARLAGAHQTLQLPIILRVRNLENGLELVLRVNDRGPASAGRLLSVTPRAARLLGMIPGQATRVQIEEDQWLSQALWKQVDDAPAPDIVAAPLDTVQERSLMPGGRGGVQPVEPPVQEQTASDAPEPASTAVKAGPPDPGLLWVDAGQFSQPRYARRLAAILAGSVHQDGRGRSASFNVRVGPFDRTAEADAALDRARSAGVTGARIIVE